MAGVGGWEWVEAGGGWKLTSSEGANQVSKPKPLPFHQYPDHIRSDSHRHMQLAHTKQQPQMSLIDRNRALMRH